MNTEMILIGLLIILIALLLVVLFVVLKQQKHEDHEELDRLQKQLLDFQLAISQSVRNDMNMLNENTAEKLNKMQQSLNQQVNVSFESTGKVFREVMNQIGKIDKTQEQLTLLSHDISSLHNILNDKKTRGIYGEVELYQILENAFGLDQTRYQKQYKLSNGHIVDAIIFGNDALGKIPVDSKFPLENFNRLMDPELVQAQKTTVYNMFKHDVKKHIDAIATKYLIKDETSEFAYMFIPAEAIFSYISSNMEEVITYSYQKHVYLVSPTTLMAYITAIKALYLGQQKNEKMQDIQMELNKLAVEFDRFTDRYQAVANDLQRTHKDMQQVLITANKIEKRFRQIEAVELEEVSETPNLPTM
ncbi:DNA recombination protein RmuC [Breznakia blatticola]|uniref:DNA recombination protein RmuC n=1 Tax=Breznakia blatticola TaxID=1754012 RepID=A0A4R7ZET6_9FIRM|nr:DNA recombination protein RmuC [Breznakia blatticola]TDW14761.1 DNA recombination protein RmuC [Breznakia blatticola]